MHGNEQKLEAACEEADHKQDVAAVTECFRQSLHQRLLLRAARSHANINRWSAHAEGTRDHQKCNDAESNQGMLPAKKVDESHRQWRKQKLTDRASCRTDTEGDAAPLGRHQLAER